MRERQAKTIAEIAEILFLSGMKPTISNFSFLEGEFKPIWESAVRMEKQAMADARAGCFYARRTIEQVVKWLYEHDAKLRPPYSSKLAALLEEPTFAKVVAPEIRAKLSFVRALGNQAVHSRKPIRQYDSLQAVKEVFHCCFWLVSQYTRFSPKVLEGVVFDEAIVTQSPGGLEKLTIERLKKLEEELEQKDKELEQQRKAVEDYDDEIKKLRAEIAKAKKRNEAIPIDHDYNEAETRDRYIDVLLREAGWDPDFDDGTHKSREFPVSGMPNESGIGYVDNVLWGKESRIPLAVVESKRTRKDARIGRNQAKLYADCLETIYGVRPIIFYTNGYDHWIWDDQRYPPRQIQGFLKEDELELLIQRRETAKDLAKALIDKEIAGRYYQEQGNRHTTEALMLGQRKVLIVMATGSGKTRTVIALCDLLQRCNWVKRMLFLADRVALVSQATNAFKAHLPHSNPVNLVTQKEDATSRVYLSTYPTMMSLIDEASNGQKRFGVGHFDLIVIDEAHRSVYRKYRAIFDYFDSILVGLTATPRDEVDRDTYSLFELARGVPTYAYELEQAVADGYLVPPKLVSVPIRFPREGIRYDDLPEEEKEQWDMLDWDEEGNVPDQVDATAVNKWLFNKDTVDKVLEHVMKNGLRVEAGQKIGKTIIFAKNHQHAMFIQERFDANYPHLKGKFARVIDNKESYAQDLIDKFSAQKNAPKDAPQIAISVDMLDTGIDVPDVVNLVFFKIVRSKTKFWQMIGRGTRLCPNKPDLHGPGLPKECFYVFDYCGNFEFFNENPEGVEGNVQESIGTKIFRTRLDLIAALRQSAPDEETLRVAEEVRSRNEEFEEDVVDLLHGEILSMNVENFIVRPKRRHVEVFQKRDRWKDLSVEDFATLHNELALLPTQQEPEHPTAKYFDLLILRIQLGTLQPDPATPGLIQKVREIASQLEELERIPTVKKQIALIHALQTDDYWEHVTLPMLDIVRRRIRDLVKHIERGRRKIVTTDFEDEIGEGTEVQLANISAAVDRAQYKKKFQEFLKQHENQLALKKVKYNEPLTKLDLEELERMLFESGGPGNREEFVACYGSQESLGLFIRGLVGLDREAAKKAFDSYLDTTTFDAKQIEFINQVIDYLTQNGVMDPRMLFEHPFTNLSPGGPTSLFSEDDAAKIVQVIRSIRMNAAAAG
ncbi:MAG: DEAD/DEAH box helicase family protein [Luteolibacter sp.]|jgi:type I restriction enzyme R subunit|nr:DEAD/DEAH box helicase family protein [Luteolibacter sp.]